MQSELFGRGHKYVGEAALQMAERTGRLRLKDSDGVRG